MLSGNDCMVVAATGTGKTLCFYLAAITLQQKTFIVVCPLLNLMEDQVCRAKALGIKAVAINMASSQQDTGLIDRVLNGQFELVFVSPEWCVPHNTKFQALTGSATFRKRIGGIVVDEAHLVHGWRTFRPRYQHLGLLRSFFPKAPILAVSATMTPYVRRFIHHSLAMNDATRFIHRTIDRPNIFLAAIPITKGVNTMRDLDFVIREWLDSGLANHIPQTIIFMDSRKAVCDACNHLWDLLPEGWRHSDPLAVAEISTALSQK
jgi:superfamily II DNA helicase RecQ